jgi:hypothetical protein
METARRASAFIAVVITGMRDAWVLPIVVGGQRAAHIVIHLLIAVLTFAHSLSPHRLRRRSHALVSNASAI